MFFDSRAWLTHWGRVQHICINKLITIGSDNGLSPGRHQAIIWTSAGILVIAFLGINFVEILIEMNNLSFKKMHLKLSSAKWIWFRLDMKGLLKLTEVQALSYNYIRCFIYIHPYPNRVTESK